MSQYVADVRASAVDFSRDHGADLPVGPTRQAHTLVQRRRRPARGAVRPAATRRGAAALGPVSTHTASQPARDPVRVLEELYRRNYSHLLAFVMKFTLGDLARAEDVVQETMTRAWCHVDELDPTDGAARPWLFTVARRIAIDRIRALSSRPNEVRGDALEFWPANEDPIDRAVGALDIQAALATLSPEHREVLVQLYLRDRSIEECAHLMGIPEGTVKSRAYYALRMLRRSLSAQPARS